MESSDDNITIDWEPLRAPLAAVVRNGNTHFDTDLGVEAIAAAVVLASQLPGGEALVSWYEPDVPPDELDITVPSDIPPLALRALNCLVGEESEWNGPWEAAGSFKNAAAVVQAVRVVLVRATGGPVSSI